LFKLLNQFKQALADLAKGFSRFRINFENLCQLLGADAKNIVL
jgi:hypothetical protein